MDTTHKKYRTLENDLKNEIKGEVCFGNDYRALYATDASNYRQLPVGVVFPMNKDDIKTIVALCRKHALHLLTRGGGTSLAGQCCNDGLVMDFSRHYNKIIDIDVENRTARIQTGLVLDDLNREVEKHGLIFGPDPATHNHCTLGGMMGNNSCGIHSVMAQVEDGGIRTSDFVDSLEILTYRGTQMEVGSMSEDELHKVLFENGETAEIYSRLKNLRDKYQQQIKDGMPQIPRRVSGYNLDELLEENNFNVARALVGTESTCAVFLEATVRLISKPKERTLVILGYPSVFEAGDHVTEIMKHKPIGLEGIDKKLIQYMHKRHLHEDKLSLLPEGEGWLLVEFGGDTKEESDEKANKLMKELKANSDDNSDSESDTNNDSEDDNSDKQASDKSIPKMKRFDNPEEEEEVWKIRESGLGATAFVKGLPDMWPGWEDSAVPPKNVGSYLRKLRELFKKHGYNPSLYGHFGQGCIHCRVGFDLKTKAGIANYKSFTDEAADLVVRFGGSLSGEHGDGQARGPLLEKMYGKELMEAFHVFKEIWDPDWKMNPGKVLDPMARDENLRLGTDFNPQDPETYFQYPDDDHSFHRAVMRCVGVGECRKTETGTMCPSYMVTRDEKDVTRGRAHLLFEMMRGEEIEKPWKSKEVKESLELCLACKGCLTECPVHVDMATYKAEFFANYFKKHLRPRSAFAFGLIDKWAALGSGISGFANALTQNKVFGGVFKSIGGIASQRQIPKFAKKSYRAAFKGNAKNPDLENSVILWADTFNNYFFPEVLEAGEKVLRSGGFEVIVPKRKFCCGRALYDFGMLDRAKSYLKDILENMRDYIEAGVPFVGLEASCIAVFRNELCNLYPNNNDAKRLKENFKTLPEFILKHEDKFHFSDLKGSALMHRHCHHHAVMGYGADKKVLKKAGLEVHVPDSGCCGLAGSFGFEKGKKYEISVKAGERRIFPAVREMDETYLITDGFSCREQINHGTGKMPMHTAEILAKAVVNTKAKNTEAKKH